MHTWQRYPRLSEELGSFPLLLASGAEDISATRLAANLEAEGQATAAVVAVPAAGDTSKGTMGHARTDARNGVPQAPRKSSQAKPLEVGGSSQSSGGAEEADASADAGEVTKEDVAAREADLGRRRDELASLVRVGSPATNTTTSRHPSKEGETAGVGPAAEIRHDEGFGGGLDGEKTHDAQRSRNGQESDEELPSTRRISRTAAKNALRRVKELETDQSDAVDAAATSKSAKQPVAGRYSDDDMVATGLAARKARRAGSPASVLTVSLRRSARLSPQPANLKGNNVESRSSNAEGAGEEAKEVEPGDQSRPRRGAAHSDKKKVVQPAAKQKRDREADADDSELLTSLSEASDSADDTFMGRRGTRKVVKAAAKTGKVVQPASKRRKIDVQESDENDLTDYEEFSLQTREQRRHKQKFGKTIGLPRSNGTTRKANQPAGKTPASNKSSSKVGNKPESRAGRQPGSKATAGKAPTKPTRKTAERNRESGTDMSIDELEEFGPTRSLRTPRSAGKKVVARPQGHASAGSE